MFQVNRGIPQRVNAPQCLTTSVEGHCTTLISSTEQQTTVSLGTGALRGELQAAVHSGGAGQGVPCGWFDTVCVRRWGSPIRWNSTH